ncbi:hypothetical protein [Kitasatospora sp. NPDC057500]|uniref:hypothetical protein n=1 Tax=Kitasatospora sp. NPDC057500 TaxID=3346151 RepID=UPI0036C994B0
MDPRTHMARDTGRHGSATALRRLGLTLRERVWTATGGPVPLGLPAVGPAVSTGPALPVLTVGWLPLLGCAATLLRRPADGGPPRTGPGTGSAR